MSITDLSHIIQLAVTPVFLLAGISGFLNVMTGRLGRIVDRARVLERRRLSLQDKEQLGRAGSELSTLWLRIKIINRAIGLCTSSGLFVCSLIVALFAGGYWNIDLSEFVISLFVIALGLLIISLLYFIRETQLATQTLKEGGEFLDEHM